MKYKAFRSTLSKYLTKFAAYGLAGIVAAFMLIIFFAIRNNSVYLISDHIIFFLTLGLVASLIYYHLSLIIDKNV